MKTTNSFGVYFTIRVDKEKDGIAPIYAGITVNGTKSLMALQEKVSVKCWDINKGLGKNNTAEGKKINAYLEEVRQSITACYKDLQLQRKVITVETVKATFLRTGSDEHTLAEIATYHNETSAGVLAAGTMKNYYTTQKYIEEFVQAHFKRKAYFLTELNYKFILDFETFLRKRVPVDHQKPLTNNGIMKHLERFRKMINLAYKLEWIHRDPFEKFQLKFNRVEKDYLSGDELAALEQKELSLPRLSVVRDIFVFCCYTGLAFVDVANLSYENIVKGQDGELWIKTSRQKTTVPVDVPLLDQAKTIMGRYKNNIRARSGGTIFPMISNQKMNSYLKELAERCDITKVLTFHIARHTFATTVTLLNGVPMETVSKLLGHTTMRSTQVYAKVIEKKVSEDMAKLNLLLSK
ncbi:site-specific integrase [Mucilaginibacter corticis]|uniref:Site-specific integrase n=1 Tax=Mucilaginibacter corticis TaxID=2597670 RepID=A0A556MLY8_9SPHI|nr:site-specific integrase [Mucilaginibacter corticis]TSJ40913.1 site-specific integrase [Mucilaginibacter corticis]